MMSRFSKTGFTLIELLVIIGLIVIMAASIVAAFHYYGAKSDLSGTATRLVSLLRLAQNKTLASENEGPWGIHFDLVSTPQKFTLFNGQSFATRDHNFDKDYKLSKGIQLSNINLAGGGNEIVFTKVYGTTQQIGQVSLWLTTDHSQTETIYIDGSGKVQAVSEVAGSDSQRVKDFRHSHLDYSRTIDILNEKIKLTFNQEGTPVVTEIPIASSLVDNQFYWEVELSVAGSMQKVLIHTHRLNSPDTQFCIHRDGQDNSKSLMVDISGDIVLSPDLVSYNASGSNVVKGNSFFVSDPMVQ